VLGVSKRFSAIYLVVVVLISVGLQIFAASQRSFWEDEAFTSTFARQGPEIVAKMTDWDVHPPLYMYMAASWGKVFGYDEFGLRLLSILFSEFTLFLVYFFARTLMDTRTALAAVTILSFSPLFLMFGNNARYYSLATFLTVAVVFSMWQYSKSRKPIYLLSYILSSIAFLYLLFASVVVIAASAGWWFVNWRRREQRSLLDVLIWLMAQTLVFLAYLPGIQQLTGVLDRAPGFVGLRNVLVALVKSLTYVSYVYALGETLSPLNPIAWLGGLVILGIAVYALLRNWRKIEFWLPISFVFLIVVSAVLVMGVLVNIGRSTVESWQNVPSRALYVLPFFAIWLGAGFAALPPRWLRLAVMCVGLAYAIGIYNFFAGQQYLRPIFAVPWRTIFSEIEQQARPGALVICGEGDSACNYYSHLYGFQGLGPGALTDQIQNSAPEVWWIQNNLSLATTDKEKEQAFLSQLSQAYATVATRGFGKQDPGIRRLKSWFLVQDNYEFRVLLYHFGNP
jgi:uncharacterized membrane protein